MTNLGNTCLFELWDTC